MNFWHRVETLCEHKGVNRKELALIAGIDTSTISKGLKNATCPSADKAVEIAKFLGTSVEYLVCGNITSQQEPSKLYRNVKLIEQLETLPSEHRSSIELIISDMCEKYSKK